MIAIIFAIVKAIPQVEAIFAQVMALYVNWKIEQNKKATDDKDSRNDAAILAARSGLPKLCDSCPFTSINRGQHGATDAAPAVPSGGDGRS